MGLTNDLNVVSVVKKEKHSFVFILIHAKMCQKMLEEKQRVPFYVLCFRSRLPRLKCITEILVFYHF